MTIEPQQLIDMIRNSTQTVTVRQHDGSETRISLQSAILNFAFTQDQIRDYVVNRPPFLSRDVCLTRKQEKKIG